MSKVRTFASKVARGVGKVARWVLPNFVLGHEKAIAGFVAPIAVAELASVAGLHVEASLVQQVVGALLISVTVHTATNTAPQD